MSSTRLPRVELLSSGQIEQIVGEAIAVLAEVGVVIENTEAVERLTAAGATVSDDGTRVFIRENLVDQCLRTCPGRGCAGELRRGSRFVTAANWLPGFPRTI